MIPLLIGLVALFAARRAVRYEDVHPARWIGVIAGLTLLQLWLGRDELTRYRITLLGLRHAVAAEGGTPRDATIRVSGDYDDADLYVPAAGGGDIALLEPRGDSALAQVVAAAAEDASAVVAVEEQGRFGRPRWRVLGATPLSVGDTVVVRGGGRVYALAVEEVPDTFALGSVPLPWTERHALVDAEGGRVVLPAAQHQPLRRFRGAQPSVFARAYPIADVVHAVDPDAAALPALGSFLFYDDGRLTLADLDAEVEAPRAAAALPVWTREDGGKRLLIAGLPLRDYREADLTLPERYGIRPLRTIRFEVNGRWLDALFATPEIQAFDREALEALRLPRDESGAPAYRVRVSHARNSMVREAIVFDAPPRSFAAGSQAILALPEDARAGAFDIVTPSGTARWATGRPLPLGTTDRSLLVRVDGQATSAGFWLVHVLLFGALGGMLWARRTRGAPLALALLAVALLSVRLLLDVSALVDFPFVGEGHQIGLWLLPVLPWAIVVAGEVSERWHDRPRLDPALRLHGAYATAMVVLSLVLFAGSPAKQLVLALVPCAVFALRAVTAARRIALPRMAGLRRRIAHLPGWARSGIALGAALLVLRVLLDLIGWREGVRIGGTRIAVSVLYTPLVLCALAWLVRRWDVRIRDGAADREPAATSHLALRALFSIGGFLAFAFVAVAAWISDFGIVLVGLPGVLLLVAALGVRWAPGDLQGRLVRLTYALPLLLFVLLQTAPTLLVPSASEVARSDVRMSEWNRNELLLLERGDPHSLRLIGQRRSEALAVMRETMRSYTRSNWFGRGFLEGRVSHEIQDTATREHAVSALLAAQWGLAGTVGLVLVLLGVLTPVAGLAPDAERDRRVRVTARDVALLLAVLVVAAAVLPTPFDLALVLIAAVALFASAASPAFAAGRADPDDDAAHRRDSGRALPFAGLVAALALLTFASAGLYMVLANYGLVFFTGKNVYLLGLDSVSDALEGLVLLAIGAAGAAWLPAPTAQLHAGRTVALPKRAPRALPRATPVTTP